jgi:ATP-dependent helicase Lhr and Lhr-like helicase
LTALQPRVSWDRTHNRLLPLPGTRSLALVNGGTIPDTGQYAAYTANGVRIGELDEEFIYERRVGDTFLLGTNTWRLDRVETDRVVVLPAEGAPALVPFWRGERVGRSYDLGLAVGQFLRDVAERIDAAECSSWLESEYFLEPWGAKIIRNVVRRQLDRAGCVPSDNTVLVEAFRDPLGDWQIAILSPLGSRLHFALRLALEARLRERLGYSPQCLHHDDGILVRLADTDEPPLDLFENLTSENVERLVLNELADSALFALRFRQNAARALLLPRMRPGKRAPLWLQRLRGRDLLQVARRSPDFPIVAETLRECVHDHLDLPRLQQWLGALHSGRRRVVTRRAESPSPFASGLLFAFTGAFMYQYDGAEPEPGRAPILDQQLLEQLLTPQRQAHLLDPRAVQQVERRLRGLGQPPRTAAEMAEWLRRLGDLSAAELEGPMLSFLQELEGDGRAMRITLPGVRDSDRWVLAEDQQTYQRAFLAGNTDGATHEAGETILERFLQTHALVGLRDVLHRYPFEPDWTRRKLEEWALAGRVVTVTAGAEPLQWSAPANLQQVQRGSLAILRREVIPSPPTRFADFLLRWQFAHPAAQRSGEEGLAEVLARLEGLPAPAALWERTILPSRLPGLQAGWLDQATLAGQWTWTCQSDAEEGPGLLAFWSREKLAFVPSPLVSQPVRLSSDAETILDLLRSRGASFVADLARESGMAPSSVRATLWNLVRRRLVTNDRFDVVRKGEGSPPADNGRTHLPGRRPTLSSLRRRGIERPEGRWALIPWGHPEPEVHAMQMAALLLERYGVAARELAMLDPGMPPWRVLYELLSRMELTGEVRRGYFVEGLTGAQFALPEAAEKLQELDTPSTAAAPVILLHSQDPANLYGAGLPFDIPLLDGGTQPFARRAGNWLVLRAGRPVLLIEQQGKRLTALPSGSSAEIADAVACLPAMLNRDHGLEARHKMTVEEWNNRPVTAGEGRELLEAAGFVRDYQSMSLYAAWR